MKQILRHGEIEKKIDRSMSSRSADLWHARKRVLRVSIPTQGHTKVPTKKVTSSSSSSASTSLTSERTIPFNPNKVDVTDDMGKDIPPEELDMVLEEERKKAVVTSSSSPSSTGRRSWGDRLKAAKAFFDPRSRRDSVGAENGGNKAAVRKVPPARTGQCP